jgi:hypothetical protein
MVPLVIAAAVAAAQMYNAEKARGASERRLNDIKKEFDRIVPPDLNVNVWDDPDILNDIPETSFDMSAITPKTIEMVGKFNPEIAQRVQEEAPQLAKASSEAQAGRKAQMDALRKYQDTASMGYSPVLEAQLMEAQRQTRREAQGAQQSILQGAARRGALTSGAALAAQMGGAADQADRMAIEAQRAALAQYGATQDALGRSAALGGNVRESEMNEAQRNADVLNSFNERSARTYQDYLQRSAETKNKANLRNLDEQQRISEANIQNDYNSRRANQESSNRYRAMTTQEKAANRAAQMDIASKKQQTKQMIYDNAMAKASAKSGVGYARANNAMQSGRDYASAIQGLGDSAQAAYGASAKQSQPPKQNVIGGVSEVNQSQNPYNSQYGDEDDRRYNA